MNWEQKLTDRYIDYNINKKGLYSMLYRISVSCGVLSQMNSDSNADQGGQSKKKAKME